MAIVLTRTLTVDAGVDEALGFLGDPERVVPCIPSARVLRAYEDGRFEGEIGLRLGPFSAQLHGAVAPSRSPDGGRIRLTADARDLARDAEAKMVLVGELARAEEGGARVELHQEVGLSGSLSALSESALAENVADMLFGRFARCVEKALSR